MPHSTQTSIDTQSNYSVERPLTATSVVLSQSPSPKLVTASNRRSQTQTATRLLEQSVPLFNTTIDSREDESKNSWKRSSAVIADAYASLIGTSDGQRDMIYEMPERNSVNYGGGGGDSESKKRIQHYDDAFEYKADALSSARERVHNEAPVVAELRTNVIIKDEFTLVTDLSYHLAARYTRPDSSIMINIDHSACLALAGTFEPCYILTITTVPSQMQPVTNKRNAALIQAFMADILSVPADRGIVRFTPIPEENLAMNGNTMLGEVERLEKAQSGDTAIKRSISDARKSIPVFSKKSSSKLETIPAQPNGVSETIKQSRRRSNTASPSPSSPIPNVFELAGSKEEERPSTSSGNYAALNGLRLNGVSKDDLVGPGSRLLNGRPKTFSGIPAPLDATAENEPLPSTNGETTPKAERRKSAIPTSAKPLLSNPPNPKSERPSSRSNASSTPNTSTTPKPVFATIPAAAKTPEPRPSPSKSLSTTTATTTTARTAATKAAGVSDASRENGRDPAANTAKRRSNITATPTYKTPVAPPPVPESKPMPKMGKRKSFLSAFRR